MRGISFVVWERRLVRRDSFRSIDCIDRGAGGVFFVADVRGAGVAGVGVTVHVWECQFFQSSIIRGVRGEVVFVAGPCGVRFGTSTESSFFT